MNHSKKILAAAVILATVSVFAGCDYTGDISRQVKENMATASASDEAATADETVSDDSESVTDVSSEEPSEEVTSEDTSKTEVPENAGVPDEEESAVLKQLTDSVNYTDGKLFFAIPDSSFGTNWDILIDGKTKTGGEVHYLEAENASQSWEVGKNYNIPVTDPEDYETLSMLILTPKGIPFSFDLLPVLNS